MNVMKSLAAGIAATAVVATIGLASAQQSTTEPPPAAGTTDNTALPQGQAAPEMAPAQGLGNNAATMPAPATMPNDANTQATPAQPNAELGAPALAPQADRN